MDGLPRPAQCLPSSPLLPLGCRYSHHCVVLHGKRYTVAWSLFLCLFYFTHGIVEAYSDAEARWLALTEVALSLRWLVGGIGFIRASRSAAT